MLEQKRMKISSRPRLLLPHGKRKKGERNGKLRFGMEARGIQ